MRPAAIVAAAALIAAALTGLAPAQASPPGEPTAGHTTVAPSPRANTFPQRFAMNAAGDLEITGNTLMTCAYNDTNCAAAQGASTSGKGKLNNNDFNMQWVDVDSDSSTPNSSSAFLDIPNGVGVLFAGLYWSAGSSGTDASGKPPAGADLVKLRLPHDLGYTSLTADQYWTVSTSGSNKTYSAFKDVTNLVKATGRGDYMVGDVKLGNPAGSPGLGMNQFAGWSLIVVYADATQPVRAMSVYDGLVSVTQNTPATIDVSGFKTPPSGVVRTELGFVAYEGDLNLTGDQFQLNGTALADGQRPSSNFFDAGITTQTGQLTRKTPDYRNQLGFDTGVIAPDGLIKNNATSAQFKATSTGDQYYPAALTFSTELYSPRFSAQKAVADLDGSPTKPGHRLQYTLTAMNNAEPAMGDAALNTQITDPWPAGATYVPGSVKVNGVSVPDSGGAVTIGATALTVRIGQLGVGKSSVITYDMTVDANAAGSTITNAFTMSGNGLTTGLSVQGASNVVQTPVTSDVAGLSIRKTATDQDPTTPGADFIAGRPATWTLSVKNTGAGTAEMVVVDDTLPTGFDIVSADGDGWNCTINGQRISCTRPQLLPGRAAPDITIRGEVPSDAAHGATLVNTAYVSSDTPDPDPSGKSSTSTVTIERRADLSIVKQHQGQPVHGEDFTYTISTRNAGPSVASGVTVTDTLPPDLTFVSATGDGWSCTPAIVCTYSGDLPAARTASDITVVATVKDTAGDVIRNTATVAGNETDPDPSNNSSTDTSDGSRYVDLIESVSHTGTASAGGPPVPVTVRALNGGPSAVPTGSQIKQVVHFPQGTTYSGYSGGSWHCIPGSGSGPESATCTETLASPWAAGQRIDDLVFQVAVDAGETGAKTVTGTVSTSADVIETNPDNNTASDVLTVSTSADLALTTSSSAELIAGGESKPLSFTVTNLGPSTDPGPFTVTFTPLPGLDIHSAAGNPWTCPNVDGHLVCSLNGPSAAAGESLPAILLVVSAPDPAMEDMTIDLTGVVYSPAPDPNPDNDYATAPITVRTFAQLTATKTTSPTKVYAGMPVTFTLTAANEGPSIARGISLVDDLGALGLSVISLSVTEGQADCSGSSTTTVNCTSPQLGVGQQVTVTVRARTPDDWTTAHRTVVNELTVTSRQRDGNPPTATSEFETDPYSTLAIAKSTEGLQPGATLVPGQPVTYLLRVRNEGPTEALGATVTDTLPANLTYSTAHGEGWACSIEGRELTCVTDGALQAGTAAPVIQVETIVDPDATGTIDNTATVDPRSPGKGGSDSTRNPVEDGVDLAISHVGPASLDAGDDWTTSAIVTNNGPAREKGPIIVVLTQEGATPLAASGDGWQCTVNAPRVRCVADRGLAAGFSLPPITITSSTPLSGTSALSTAHVSGTSRDTNPDNNTSQTAVELKRDADLALTKTVDQVNVVAGQPVTFTLTVTNNGPGTVGEAVAVDSLPADLTFLASGSDPRCAAEDVIVTCSVTSPLRRGESTSFDFRASVAVGSSGKRTNKATVFSAQPDPNPSNNTDSAKFVIRKSIEPQIPLIVPPDKVKDQGVTPIYPTRVPTNAGQTARIKITCQPLVQGRIVGDSSIRPRGDLQPCRYFTTRGGGIDLFTPGTDALLITIIAKAPEVPGYTSMRVTYTFHTKATR